RTHHPREVRDREYERRVEETARRHGRGEQQSEVLREKERRERRHDAAEGEKREEREEEPRETEAQQVVAEIGVVGELRRDPARAVEDRAEDARADDAEEHR